MKTIHFNCPGCDQSIETPASMAGTLLDCPNCRKQFSIPGKAKRKSNWFLIVVLAAFGAVLVLPLVRYIHRQEELLSGGEIKQETPYQKDARWEAEAKASMGKYATNMVGFSRLIDCYVSTDPAFKKWTGEITIDYVNKVGGVERTNVPFIFNCSGGWADNLSHVYCIPDVAKIMDADAKRFQAELDAISRK